MIAPDLSSLQYVFQRHVLGGAPGIESHVLSSVGASAQERVGVYTDAYHSRLLEVLEKDFPGVRSLIGHAEFERLGQQYIKAYSSDSRSIRWYGQHLPALLRRERRDRPVLIEMADFEWQQGEVFDALDARAITSAEIAAIPAEAWPRMRLRFQPCLRQLDLGWNVVEYWQAMHDKGPLPAPRLAATRVHWLLWRRSLAVRWRSLAVDEGLALTAAMDGAPFGEICEHLGEPGADQDTALRAASLLKRWVEDELILGLAGI